MELAPTFVGMVGLRQVPGQRGGGWFVCKAEEGRVSVVGPSRCCCLLRQAVVVEVGQRNVRSTTGIYGEMEAVLAVLEVVERY